MSPHPSRRLAFVASPPAEMPAPSAAEGAHAAVARRFTASLAFPFSPGRAIWSWAVRRPPVRLVLFGLFILTGGQGLLGAEAVSKEYQLKAAFLYNFSKFTQWPAERFADAKSPIVIAVLGQNPFGDELEKVVKDRLVNGRAIAVRHLGSAAELPSAHIVFVTPDAEPLLAPDIRGTQGILTVGETPGFAARGGIITFTVLDEKVRFEIDQGSAEKAGVKISGQLLKLATVVRKAP